MRIPFGRPGRHALLPVLLAVLTLCIGCQTAHQPLFVVSGPAWHIRQGQAVWKPRRNLPELSGDLIFASDDQGRFFIEFDKTPMTLVSAQATPYQWAIQFPPGKWYYFGHGRPSTRFAWFYLPAALAGKPLPKVFHFDRKPDGSWRLENSHNGESIEGFLAP